MCFADKLNSIIVNITISQPAKLFRIHIKRNDSYKSSPNI